MNRSLLTIFLLSLFVINPNASKATHLAGAEVNWQHVGKDSFEVTLSVYRDCTGIDLSTPTLNVGCKSGSIGSVPVKHLDTTIEDVTSNCSNICNACSPGSCSNNYGFEAHRYTYLVDLTNVSCCKVKFYYSDSRRSNSITTGLDGEDIYVESWVNTCQAPQNSAPELTQDPVMILCKGQGFKGNPGAIARDTASDGSAIDSFAYELAQPTGISDFDYLSYDNPYSYLEPLDYKGINFGGPNQPFPFGFHLDANTGTLKFTPTKKQTSVISLFIKEFREVNGNMKQVGKLKRDYIVQVRGCSSNSAPEVKGIDCQPNNYYERVCAGSVQTFKFCSNDPDKGDSVRLNFNKGDLPGKTKWEIIDSTAQYQTGRLTWYPQPKHASSKPYRFTVGAKDNHCPVNARDIKSYQVKVKPKPTGSFSIDTLACGQYRFTIDSTTSNANTNFLFGNTSYRNQDTVIHQFQSNGKQPVRFQVSKNLCSRNYYDTLEIDSLFTVHLGDDTTVCPGSNVKVSANVNYPQGPVSYTWHDSLQGVKSRIIKDIQKDTTIAIAASDGNCTMTDSLTIHLGTISQQNPVKDTRMCNINDTIVIDAPGFGNQYQWSNNTTGDSLQVTDTGTYHITIKNQNGCTQVDSFEVGTWLPLSVFPNQLGYCEGDSLQLKGPQAKGLSHKWDNGDTSSSRYVKSPGDYWLQAMKDSACYVRDTVTVTKNSKPNKDLPDSLSKCPKDAVQISSNNANVNYYWNTGDTSKSINAQSDGIYSVKMVSDSGCKTYDSTFINDNDKPKTGLTADTTICQTQQVKLSAQKGYANYNWSTGDSTSSITVSKPNTYTIQITNSNGCSTLDTVKVRTLNDCVWPGDANNDLVANNKDILQIGVKHGLSGIARASVSTNWQPFQSTDWNDTFNSGLNTKFADANGDGLVNHQDTLAVSQNYGKQHNKKELEGKKTPGATPLKVTITNEKLTAGDTAQVKLTFGDEGQQTNKLYGIAANISYKNELIVKEGIQARYFNTWLQTGDPDFLGFTQNFSNKGRMEIAATRTNQTSVSGSGDVAYLKLPLKTTIEEGASLEVEILGEYLIDELGEPVAYSKQAKDSLTIEKSSGKAPGVSIEKLVNVYPNPANDKLFIASEIQQPVRGQLLNMHGQVVRELDLNKGVNSVNLASIPAGVYQVRIETPEGVYHKKIIAK